MQRAVVCGALVLVCGCTPTVGGFTGGDEREDAGTDAAAPIATEDGSTPPPRAGCDPEVDADGDGIADYREGEGDFDLDGVPNREDSDTDGDGLSDDEEWDDDPCGYADSDGDGTVDPLDLDSDNDGLFDADEHERGTDATEIDSDGDGVTDLGEVQGTGTDPLDPASTIDPSDFFVVLPYLEDPQMRPLQFGTEISKGDVFFLVDTTGSMREERANLIDSLVETVIPGLEASIPDLHLGVGGFADYPATGVGGAADLPFFLLRAIAPANQDLGAWSHAVSSSCPASTAIGSLTGLPNSIWDVLDAVRALPCHWGADWPESYIPALSATATGSGLSWPSTGSSFPAGSISGTTCTAGSGYPCFRSGALPVVVLIGDATFHNGPDTATTPYSFAAPTYSETVDQLNGIGARLVGVYSGVESVGRSHFRAAAAATGAVDAMGNPLVLDINPDGTGLDSAIVDVIHELVSGTPQDVSTRTENVSGNPMDVDATQFIESIRPVRVVSSPAGSPPSSMDETTFHDVTPGSVVEFDVSFYNDIVPPADRAQIFKAVIVVVGNGVADLDWRQVYIVVPPADGEVVVI